MKGFYNRGKNSAIIHCSCPLWSCRSFGVAELSSAFILFKKLPHCWFGHSKFLLSLWLVCFGRFSTPSPKNLKTAFSIFRINSAFLFFVLICFICHCENERMGHEAACHNWQSKYACFQIPVLHCLTHVTLLEINVWRQTWGEKNHFF